MAYKKLKKTKEKLRPCLYEDEIVLILKAAEKTRYPLRNKLLMMLTYNHGFRSSEACNLKWGDIDFQRNTIQANRLKNGVNFIHDLLPVEKELLLEFYGEGRDKDDPVFSTERGKPFNRYAYYFLIQSINQHLNIDTWFDVRGFRHGKGVFLREKGVSMETIRDYLGHKHMSSTEIYTRMAKNPFFKNINEGSIFA